MEIAKLGYCIAIDFDVRQSKLTLGTPMHRDVDKSILAICGMGYRFIFRIDY